MQVKKVWLAVGILISFVGIPGILEDLQTWEKLLSMWGEWRLWNYLSLAVGLGVSIWSLLPVFYQKKPFSRKKDKWMVMAEKLEPDQLLDFEKSRNEQHMTYVVVFLFFLLIAMGISRC